MTGWEMIELFFLVIVWCMSLICISFCIIVFGYLLTRVFTAAYWRSKLDVMKRHKQAEGED